VKKSEVESLSKEYLSKLKQYYGESKFQTTTVYLSIETSGYSDKEDKNVDGEYCAVLNEIVVYWKNIKSEEHLYRTLIHEYQHYLQSPRWMTRYYKMGYNYSDHPYEIQAYKEELNWNKIN